MRPLKARKSTSTFDRSPTDVAANRPTVQSGRKACNFCTPASFSDIQAAGGSGENHWYHVTLMEGRNREVRRLWASQGLTVGRLKRVRYGAAFLPKRLRTGQWSEVSPKDHEVLREDIGLAANASGLSLFQPGASGGKDGSDKKTRKPRKSKPISKYKPRRR